MEIWNGLGFDKVDETDVVEMTEIMKRAFDEDAKIHLDKEKGGPDGYDNGEFIRRWYFADGVKAYKILKDGQLIGGINVFINDNNENYLGNVFLDPTLAGKGIGTTIWKFIEYKYPNTKIWRTATAGYSKRNHHFYVNKCGFNIVRIDNPKDEHSSFILEKKMDFS